MGSEMCIRDRNRYVFGCDGIDYRDGGERRPCGYGAVGFDKRRYPQIDYAGWNGCRRKQSDVCPGIYSRQGCCEYKREHGDVYAFDELQRIGQFYVYGIGWKRYVFCCDGIDYSDSGERCASGHGSVGFDERRYSQIDYLGRYGSGWR